MELDAAGPAVPPVDQRDDERARRLDDFIADRSPPCSPLLRRRLWQRALCRQNPCFAAAKARLAFGWGLCRVSVAMCRCVDLINMSDERALIGPKSSA